MVFKRRAKSHSTNPDSSNSKIFDEKTRQSRSFFSKCGLPEKSQGSYLEGNDRRDFSQLPHLSQKAELPKRKTLDCPRNE